MSNENNGIVEDRPALIVRFFLTYRFYILGAASLLIFALVASGVYRLTAEVRYDEVLAAHGLDAASIAAALVASTVR